MPIRVLIADDSPLMVKAIRDLLSGEPEIEIVGEAISYAQTQVMKEQYKPDIIVMDLHMIEQSEIQPTIVSKDSTVLAVSVCDPEEGKQKAEELGAAAYLDKLNLYDTLLPKIFELREAHG